MRTSASPIFDTQEDDGYPQLEAVVRRRIAQNHSPLFQTDAKDVFGHFLEMIPPRKRQHYRCNACKSFVEHYGSLVKVREDGTRESLIWSPDEVGPFFKTGVGGIRYWIEHSNITNVFLKPTAYSQI